MLYTINGMILKWHSIFCERKMIGYYNMHGKHWNDAYFKCRIEMAQTLPLFYLIKTKTIFLVFLCTYMVHVHVQVYMYSNQTNFPFPLRSVPFRFYSRFNRSGPFRSVHFRSNRLPQANSFSARHEFICKFTVCVGEA